MDNQSKTSFENSGYYMYQDDDIYIIIDGGAIGPDYLPAHAHADIFSYELSIKDQKFITDSGVYEYTKGKIREQLRSTKSHNTVAIDNLDQVECWNSFRVARRYKPSNVVFFESENGVKFSGGYEGYAKLIGDKIYHERQITINKERKEIIVSENISGKNEHLAESFIHLAPNSKVIEIRDGYEIEFAGQKTSIKILNGKKRIENSTYYPQFGNKIDRLKIVISEYSVLPLKIQYIISY